MHGVRDAVLVVVWQPANAVAKAIVEMVTAKERRIECIFLKEPFLFCAI
jgi:hypothetical protein